MLNTFTGSRSSVLSPPERPTPPAAPSQALEQPAAAAPETAQDDPVTASATSETPEEAGGPLEAVAAESEQVVRFENDVMVVEASNRGAAITSFQLIGFQGDAGEQLDLIQTVDHPDRALPLQLMDGDGPDQRLYTVEQTGDSAVFRLS